MIGSDEGGVRTLSVLQAGSILVGIVVGIGIFKTPQLVAANVGSESEFLALWLVGGLLMIAGAFTYAELGSAFPSSGGEYHYLVRAYGRGMGFVFAFGRMTVMQTGAIAAVAFAYGDYANTLFPLGDFGSTIHATVSIALFTGLQFFGTSISGRSQLTLTMLTIAILLLLAAALPFAEAPASQPTASSSTGAAGLALVFILLTYGGWNEAAYLAGDIRDVQRNMVRVLLLGTSTVIVLYLVYNSALLYAFGLDGLREAKTIVDGPAAEVFGPAGTVVAALVVCAAAISTLNATIFTGARSIYSLGKDYPALALLGRRSARTGSPVAALLVQGAIALALVALGAGAHDGFQAMVEYTAPAFWTFLFLVGLAFFVFRWRGIGSPSAFRTPFYPLPPLVFCAMCLYLIYSSVMYTGAGALVGLAIVSAGIPVYWLSRGGRGRVIRPAEAIPAE